MNNETESQLDFIHENVDDLLKEDREELLRVIRGSTIDQTKIRQKEDGVQIMFDDIPREIISTLYSFVQQKLANYSQKTIEK